MSSDNEQPIEEKPEETAETPLVEGQEIKESAMGQDFAYKPFQTDFVNKRVILRPSVVGAKLDLDLNYSRGSGGSVFFRRIDTTNADATPSVKNATLVELTGTTAITDFDDGVIGQIIFIKANGSITITHGTPIQLRDNANYAMTDGDTLTLCMFDDQVWHEIGRGSNTATVDHGGLTGLADDDHSQYHNDTRGDIRYYTQAQVDALIAAISIPTIQFYARLGDGQRIINVSGEDEAPVVWTELDISGIVGANRAWVMLECWSNGAHILYFREGTVSNDIGALGTSKIQVAAGERAYAFVQTDSAGKIDWKADAPNANDVTVHITGYLKS